MAQEILMQNDVMYICALCRRKFEGEDEMKAHEKFSELHKYNMRQKLAL